MYHVVLEKMRKAVLAGQIVMTRHAVKEIADDGLTLDDVVNILLTGEIMEQQFDSDWKEFKYVVYGDSLGNNEVGLVAKLGYNDSTIVITVFRLTIEDYDF